jgi:hypothetical protein
MRLRCLCLLMLGLSESACTSWTALRTGYGWVHRDDRALTALEVERSRGGDIHSAYGTIGARVASGPDQFDGSAHVGVMRPLRLSEKFSLVPSIHVELFRVSYLQGRWYGGAFGPAVAAELVWWWGVERHTRNRRPMFGCFGGVPGVDCPADCVSDDVRRLGFGVRASTEYNVRFAADYPHPNDWVSFLTIGFSQATTPRENECCYYARRPGWREQEPGLGEGCARRDRGFWP